VRNFDDLTLEDRVRQSEPQLRALLRSTAPTGRNERPHAACPGVVNPNHPWTGEFFNGGPTGRSRM
jgi:hypothetical protein